jgi:hypothetical protein
MWLPKRMSLSKNNKRPLFKLNATETGIAIASGIIAWFIIRNILQSTLPYPCGSEVGETLIDCGWTYTQSWEELGSKIFNIYAVPIIIFISASVIFLVRLTRKETSYFSALGNLSMAWPLPSFLIMHFPILGLYCLPIGFILAIIATILSAESEEEKKYKLDWVTLPFNLLWLVVSSSYFSAFWNAYGD